MMNSDIRLIRLCRKTNKVGVPETDNSQQYLSTDYFDVLHCIPKDPWDDFDSIMGIGKNEKQNSDDIAIQSYTLFCDGLIIDKYKDRKCYGDPFDDLAEKDKPFLSVIQVHITPELIARLESEHFNHAYGFILEIENDIHEILNKFVEEYSQPVCYRVYRLLSTGDFAIVVRSRTAETSYEISIALRRRYVETENRNEQKIVLYKTYTLLTMAHTVINTGENEEYTDHSKGNQFVIRCCFSYKYWSEKKKVDDYWKDKEGYSDIKVYYLNGRYDFTMYLTEKEFRNVFPYIALYKNINIGKNECKGFTAEESDKADAVQYLIYLLENEYLSYINERYLLDEVKILVNDKDKSIFSRVKNQEYVFQHNVEEYNRVRKIYGTEVKRIYDLCTNRDKLVHYMELLYKLIELCQTINNLSDTRISVSVLLEQIETLLVSMGKYLDYIESSEDDGFETLHLTEEYLRESVGALDAYSRYIRNNNLQSLQAPNYNIESNTSMEKILIAFSEYTYMIVQDYIYCNMIHLKRKDLPAKQYVPVVVPNLGKRRVSVEVMFPEWNIYRNQEFKNHVAGYLMIITCPTVKELGNIPTIMASLLHETAHQFRYEKRDVRNDAVLKFVLLDFFELLADRMMRKYELLKSNLKVSKRILYIFRKIFLEAFLEVWLPEAGKWEGKIEDINLINSGKKASLAYYEECIWNNMDCFLESWEDTVNLSIHINQFIRKVLQCVSVESNKIKNELKVIEKAIDTVQNTEISFNEWKNEIEKLKNSSIMLFVEGGAEIITDVSKWRLMWEEVFRGSYVLWDMLIDVENFDTFTENKKIELLEMRNALLGLCQWQSQLSRSEYKKMILIRIREKYEKAVYLRICEKWNAYGDEVRQNIPEMIMEQQLLNEAGRYFGVDYFQEDNERRFSGILKNEVRKIGNVVLDRIRDDIEEYREETADMFMCSRMSLDILGYINLIAREIVIDQEVSTHSLQRIIRVAAVMWCKLECDNFEDFYKSYQIQCTKLFREIKKYINAMLAYYGIEEWQVPIIEWGDDQSYNLNDKFLKQVAECYYYIQNKQIDDNATKRKIMHPATMLKILYGMVCDCEATLYRLFRNGEIGDGSVDVLKKDYIKGRDFLIQFKQIEREDDMKILDKRIERIAVIINEPWKEFQQKYKAEANKEIIDFLISLYYGNKRRNAQERRGEEAWRVR
ncbi:MAG: hypothetical protein HFG92_16700 [Dorea sp.]|nr:hypothetical protein [Dorea sp.]